MILRMVSLLPRGPFTSPTQLARKSTILPLAICVSLLFHGHRHHYHVDLSTAVGTDATVLSEVRGDILPSTLVSVGKAKGEHVRVPCMRRWLENSLMTSFMDYEVKVSPYRLRFL